MENIVKFEAEVIFEANVNVCGYCYLVIYGRHVNGYFCAVPNWKTSCEMSNPSDVFYNAERLNHAGFPKKVSGELAKAIKEIVKAEGGAAE